MTLFVTFEPFGRWTLRQGADIARFLGVLSRSIAGTVGAIGSGMLYVIGTKALETVTVTSVRASERTANAAKKAGEVVFPVVYGPFGGRKPRAGDWLRLTSEASGLVAVAPRAGFGR